MNIYSDYYDEKLNTRRKGIRGISPTKLKAVNVVMALERGF
ncbi:hypothetical protein NARC_130024 [Candidatus Nitrosocosmicus arcticus]|uniref:Uncharacterized protein n=1 Tax=Candidatus Nitrosocosmicus arcticus TaxID=2035267 RepID=A0A557SSV8_9ARCH|nr:hypothetical protein NARC_130024 [Candidatus Nitrosocosmicus arcticus]